jgi:hypothetical protein
MSRTRDGRQSTVEEQQISHMARNRVEEREVEATGACCDAKTARELGRSRERVGADGAGQPPLYLAFSRGAEIEAVFSGV